VPGWGPLHRQYPVAEEAVRARAEGGVNCTPTSLLPRCLNPWPIRAPQICGTWKYVYCSSKTPADRGYRLSLYQCGLTSVPLDVLSALTGMEVGWFTPRWPTLMEARVPRRRHGRFTRAVRVLGVSAGKWGGRGWGVWGALATWTMTWGWVASTLGAEEDRRAGLPQRRALLGPPCAIVTCCLPAQRMLYCRTPVGAQHVL
jgi:hypothetical protein